MRTRADNSLANEHSKLGEHGRDGDCLNRKGRHLKNTGTVDSDPEDKEALPQIKTVTS
jgi:hypothetical protein